MNKKKTRVTCIKCPKCGDIVYSRAHYDCRYCSCRSVFIDGGREYCRIGWNPKVIEKIDTFTKDIIGVTRQDLYKDWNTKKDKYGIIKEK